MNFKMTLRMNNHIQFLVKYILQTYFTNLNGMMIIFNSTNITPTKLDCLEGITSVLSNNSHLKTWRAYWINVAYMDETAFYKQMLRGANIGVQGYMVLTEDIGQFVFTKYEVTKNSTARSKDRNIIIMSEDEDPSLVLRNKLLGYFPAHLFLSFKVDQRTELWTQKYTGLYDSETPILLDIFYPNKTFARKARLYPNKFIDLQGRLLRISTSTYIPYAIAEYVQMVAFWDRDTSFSANCLTLLEQMQPGKGNVNAIGRTDKNVFFDGIEAKIMIQFCIRHNCTISVAPYGVDGWGGIEEDGHSNGSVGALHKGQVEVTLGGLYKWYYKYFYKSRSIAQSAVTLLIPGPTRLPPYTTIVLPFHKEVWYAIGFIISVSVLAYYFQKFKLTSWNLVSKGSTQNFSFTFFEIFQLYIQQSYNQIRFKQLCIRISIATFLLTNIILGNSYGGALKSLLTVPEYTDPIDTTSKFIASDLKWAGPTRTWIFSIRESEFKRDLALMKKFEVLSYGKLRNLSKTSNKYALPVEKLHRGSYSYGNYVQHDMMRSKLYFEYTYIFSEKGWPLLGELNSMLAWIIQHGLLNAFEKKSVTRFLEPITQAGLIQMSIRRSTKPLPRTLSVEDLSGPLIILIAGHFLAFVVFFCEVIAKKIVFRRKKVMKKPLKLNLKKRLKLNI